MKSLIVVLISLMWLSCKAQERIGYEKYLECISIYVVSAEKMSTSYIYGVLPTTREEANKYYSIDRIDNGKIALRKIDQAIRDECINGDIECLENHLKLSRFVDGYFAEIYFDDLSHYILKFPEFYTNRIQVLDRTEFSRFNKLYQEINR